jgi:hypothetical protein
MDLQTIVLIFMGVLQFILTGFAVVLWSLINEMRANMKELDRDFNDTRVANAKEYVSRQEFKDAIDSIKEMLDAQAIKWDKRFDRIEERLDSKADK